MVCVRQNQVDFAQAVLHVRRAKNGTPSTHPLTDRARLFGEKPRIIRRWIAGHSRIPSTTVNVVV